MSQSPSPAISDALLYEGYLLYPYRKSAIKNQFRWTFGCLHPKDWCDRHDPSERSSLQSECLIRGGPESTFDIRLRCLLLLPDGCGDPASRPDTVERDLMIAGVTVNQLIDAPEHHPFELVAAQSSIPADEMNTVVGHVGLHAAVLANDTIRISIEVQNTTVLDVSQMDRDAALRHTLISAHLLLECHHGTFISLIEPPDDLRDFAASCRNNGYWPVLAGTPGSRHQLLIAPIILYDHPQIAPESAGNLFDSTEIDEILAMRIRTLTQAEKHEVRATTSHGRQVLEHAEQLDFGELNRLHGTIRPGMPSQLEGTVSSRPPDRVRIAGTHVQAGDRVRLNPKGRSDIFDLALAGRLATVESIQQDFEDKLYVAVTADDDPGRDLGHMGLPGHRFFFGLDEVEPLGTTEADE